MAIPTIDLGAFSAGSAAERETIAGAFDEAFRTVGFCSLSNYQHLLPEEAVTALRTQGGAFFALPAAEKQKSYVDGVCGYLGPGAENVAATAGAPSAEPDQVESLNIPAYQDPPWRAAAAEAECPWAKESWLPASAVFADAALAYFGGVTRVMTELMRLAELSLALPPGHFDASYERPGTLLRIAWYPPPAEEGNATAAAADTERQQLYGAHTDFDGFTLLQRGEEAAGGGLQIWSGGEWITVGAAPRTLTINIGDLLARWTNDRWRSTKHRVMRPAASQQQLPEASSSSPPLRGRLSLVYFTGPHPDTLVECLPSVKCQPSDGPPRYAPITAYEHVLAKMQKATEEARAG